MRFVAQGCSIDAQYLRNRCLIFGQRSLLGQSKRFVIAGV
jgi:hypothetical protein